MSSYNLIDEKWIPCVMPDGSKNNYGLQDVLIRSHEIKEIFDPSPIITIALHRLLLSILYRNFNPENLLRWRDLRALGRWKENTIKEYFIKYHDYFYLFDNEKPFYQDINLLNIKTDVKKEDEGLIPLTKLARELSATSSATLFDHSFDQIPKRFPLDWAACLLVSSQFYALQDGRGYSPSTISYGINVLAKGGNLFETLLFNLNIRNSERPFPSDLNNDIPLWEKSIILGGENTYIPEGYLSYLTWPYRRILLIPLEGASEVEQVALASGPKIDKDWLKNMYDPLLYYRRTTEEGSLPIRLKKGKALWRDSNTFISLIKQRDGIEPEFINLLARSGIKQKELNVIGVASNKNKIDYWRNERFPLPFEYLQANVLLDALKKALDLAEDIGKLLGPGYIKIEISDKKGKTKTIDIPSPLRNLASELLPKDQNGKANPDDEKKFVNTLSPSHPYWAQLGISFNELLVKLPEDKISIQGDAIYGANVLQWWANQVRTSAVQAFEETTDSFDRTGRSLKAVTIAKNNFDRELNSKINKFIEPYKNLLEKGGEKGE